MPTQRGVMVAPDPIRLGLRMYDLLIHNAWVVTVNSQGDVIPDGMIGIHGDVIAHIGPRPPDAALPAARETIDAGQGIVTAAVACQTRFKEICTERRGHRCRERCGFLPGGGKSV